MAPGHVLTACPMSCGMSSVLCPMPLSSVLWLCPMAWSYVLWQGCRLSYVHGYAPPCPMSHGPVLRPMALSCAPQTQAKSRADHKGNGQWSHVFGWFLATLPHQGASKNAKSYNVALLAFVTCDRNVKQCDGCVEQICLARCARKCAKALFNVWVALPNTKCSTTTSPWAWPRMPYAWPWPWAYPWQ